MTTIVTITNQPIRIPDVLDAVSSPRAGGIDIFVGTVRDHSGGARVKRLEYTAYDAMALRLMHQVEEEIRSRWEVHGVVLIHRTGILEIGEIAVVTAVSCSHRKDAFDACRFAIDRIKAIVPIWKKEWTEEGESWGANEPLEIRERQQMKDRDAR